jgi:hypothetical protein
MKMNDLDWFGPKLLWGWGAVPYTWEGWLATAIFLAVVVLISRYPDISLLTRNISTAVALVAFLIVVFVRYKAP